MVADMSLPCVSLHGLFTFIAMTVPLTLDHWPVATWFGLRVTYFWILLARTGRWSACWSCDLTSYWVRSTSRRSWDWNSWTCTVFRGAFKPTVHSRLRTIRMESTRQTGKPWARRLCVQRCKCAQFWILWFFTVIWNKANIFIVVQTIPQRCLVPWVFHKVLKMLCNLWQKATMWSPGKLCHTCSRTPQMFSSNFKRKFHVH